MAGVPGGWPTLSELKASTFDHLGRFADWCERIAGVEETLQRLAREVRAPGGAEWEGEAADAAIAQAEMDVCRARPFLWSAADAAVIARNGQDMLEAGRRAVLDAVDDAERDGFRVGEDYSVADTHSASTREQHAQRQAQAQSHANFIRHRLGHLVAHDQHITGELQTVSADWGSLNFEQSGGARPLDNKTLKEAPGNAADEGKRRQNQIDAFKQVFGREPVSAADWDTAAALDPHSYDPKYQGVPPEIRVVRINPVPGQGEVRVSQWIEQRDVTSNPLPPFTRDLGDNRRASPNFDPENARVTTYIDYENGIVVMRQNPSVQETDGGGPGQVKVGVPQGTVTQLPDGSVRIKYDAGNPFAPGFSRNPPEPFHPWTVNGDLVFTPGPQGVHVDGTRTDYPSMEVYQDLPNGSTHTVLIDPAQVGDSGGPALNLPRHHDVGIGGRAFEPFDRGTWNPRYDIRVPLPATDFGPVSSPPSVPTPRSGPGIPA
ncbi:hypothetical protein [Mycobacterium heckeshornense]|uniref:ESX-1 secretion-associated protein EspA/EspE-like domain-containing protein n=1 Tax=Mycobacterium heckeshornense TaxID=110505 RepID=A0A7R7GPT3_9MYCO|nr:hypothetical protein [Mycobacterium heckeshornense]MCV7034597.1 hypothetical protein [Mycobacterium heckeshornense]BCO33848.1 hypothetical protein MHEC_02810 [Mycobacterium heckeshornense]